MNIGRIFGLMILMFAHPAHAQDVANKTEFGNWVVNCQAVTTTQTSCRLVQTLSRKEDQTLVARFVAVPRSDGAAVLVVQVPIGVHLPGGAVFRLGGPDGPEQREMIWQKCLGQVCEAVTLTSVEDMQLFTEWGVIVFGYRMDADAEPIVVRVDVSRFAEGIAAIAP